MINFAVFDALLGACPFINYLEKVWFADCSSTFGGSLDDTIKE